MEDDLKQDGLADIFDFYPSNILVSKGLAYLAWDWEVFSGESVGPRDFKKIPNSVIMKYGVFEDLSPPRYSQRVGDC
jgi:hypothetical protein